MRDVTIAFLAQLQRRAAETGVRRIDLRTLWDCYRDAGVVQASAGSPRGDLASILEELDAHRDLTMPARHSKKAWDVDASAIRLPQWVRMPKANIATEAHDAAPTINHITCLWPRELDFMRTLRSPRASVVRAAVAIQRWFAQPGSRQRMIVPVKERSLEIFGYEKRLEALLEGELFKANRLTLSHLRAQRIPEPLTWEATQVTSDRPRSLLIVENLSTYLSFCRWNRATGIYAAIAYGRGKLLRYLMVLLPEVIDRMHVDRIEYFGDIDAPGILFPLQARAELRSLSVTIPFEPALHWYAAMLRRGENALLEVNDPGIWSEYFAEWFPQPFCDDIRRQFELQRRLPQELVGMEYLSGQAHT